MSGRHIVDSDLPSVSTLLLVLHKYLLFNYRVYAIFPTTYLYFSIIKHCIKFVTICGQFTIKNMAASRHLGFFQTEIITIRLAIPKNPTIEPNITLIRQAVAKLWHFCLSKMAARRHIGF